MKNVFLLLIAFLTLVSNQSIAQGKLKEGVIMMELTEVDSDDPNVAGFLSGMRGSTQDIYFNQDQQKVVSSMMGGMMTTTIVSDMKAKESRTYMDMMGQKYLVRNPLGEEDNADDSEVFIDPSKTKKIAGYTCKYARITPKSNEGQDVVVEMYFTEDIQLVGSVSGQVNTKGIKGAPLEMSVSAQGFTMKYETKKVQDKLGKDAFSEPKGFKEVTQEELQKMLGGFGGF
jgi:hypothetical protein